uniref:Uncharacterized protein n=1 Tax=Arundo donax TaxID=35708 RepID=A0A0A9GWI9_ARUDO
MCARHSIASLSSMYTRCSARFRRHLRRRRSASCRRCRMSSSCQGSFSCKNRHASVLSTAANSLASSLVHRRCSRGASQRAASCSTSTTESAVSRAPIAPSHDRFSHGTWYACASTSTCTAYFSMSSSVSSLHLPAERRRTKAAAASSVTPRIRMTALPVLPLSMSFCRRRSMMFPSTGDAEARTEELAGILRRPPVVTTSTSEAAPSSAPQTIRGASHISGGMDKRIV